jgi:hypothetical protein
MLLQGLQQVQGNAWDQLLVNFLEELLLPVPTGRKFKEMRLGSWRTPWQLQEAGQVVWGPANLHLAESGVPKTWPQQAVHQETCLRCSDSCPFATRLSVVPADREQHWPFSCHAQLFC